MAVVVEDGSGIEGANSYVTAEEATEYATDRGITLSSTHLTGYILDSAQYLEGWAESFRGVRVSHTQPMAWPRTGAVIDGFLYNTSSSQRIPRRLKNCQCELIIDLQNGVDIRNRPFHSAERRVKAGEAEVEYAVADSPRSVTQSKTRELLGLLLNPGGPRVRPTAQPYGIGGLSVI